MKDKVLVLLSAYNGEKYLATQLDSILNQSYKNISILIRDDGSTDNTQGVIEKYMAVHSNIRYYKGENLGACNSFFDLMKNADTDAQYIALCDQDDYWEEEKVAVAIEAIKEYEATKNKPVNVLYCGNQRLADENLVPIDTKFSRAGLKPSFGNALVENICTGCTAVFNRNLLKEMIEHIPDFTIMHDFWLYLVASYTGKVIYDDVCYIRYRQHGGNVIGERGDVWSECKHRIQYFKSHRDTLTRQNKEFVRLFDMQGKKGELAMLVADYKKGLNRFKVITNRKVFRQRRPDDIIFRVLFLLGLR